MQALGWYIRRLGAMSPAEVRARMGAAVRDQRDRLLLATRWGLRWSAARAGSLEPAAVCAALVPRPHAAPWPSGGAGPTSAWRDALVARADKLARQRLSYFNLRDWFHGDPLDWNRDHGNGKAAPLGHAPGIDYRSFSETGDCKYVWEPNRHQHLVVLARAYRATGNGEYAAAVAAQLASWLAQCPFGRGMNWRSPLELGVRLINWAWALGLIHDAGVLDAALRRELGRAIGLQVWEIARKYARGSSANNHLIGEAAGVFVATACWPGLRDAPRRQAEAAEILESEIARQIAPDGGPREQATGYLLFIAQFFLLAGLCGDRCGRRFSAHYWERLATAFEFLAALRAGGPDVPQLGDCDDGYVLDLGGTPPAQAEWLQTAAVLFDRPDLAVAPAVPETAAWLLGTNPEKPPRALQRGPSPRLHSRAFEASGYYVLQNGARGTADAVSVIFDCGPLGYGPLAAHGHADALSFVLRAGGAELLVDPGTYDYFTYPQWRHYFRGTRAHNTITVDGVDQSEPGGPFLWTRHARARCVAFEPRPDGGRVRGMHDGYRRLPDPVVHARELDLRGPTLQIEDHLSSNARHTAEFRLHLAEHCHVRMHAAAHLEIQARNVRAVLHLDPQLEITLLRGSLEPSGGWVSRGYHQRTPAYTIVGRCAFARTLRLRTEIQILPGSSPRAALGAGQREESSRCGA